jgi:hypothetical protein
MDRESIVMIMINFVKSLSLRRHKFNYVTVRHLEFVILSGVLISNFGISNRNLFMKQADGNYALSLNKGLWGQ